MRSTIQPATGVVGLALPGRAFFISSLDQLQPRRCAGLFLYRVRGRRSEPSNGSRARVFAVVRDQSVRLRLGCLGPWQTVGDVSSLADIVMRRAPGDLGGVAGKSPGAQAWINGGGPRLQGELTSSFPQAFILAAPKAAVFSKWHVAFEFARRRAQRRSGKRP